MSAPEFQLLPWERGGYPIAPTWEMSAHVEGRLRHFLVKTREGKVYFRLADEEDTRVWALREQTPATGMEELERLFRQEIEANRVARVFLIERSFSAKIVSDEFAAERDARFSSSNLHMFGPTCFAVIVSDYGWACAQEWCGGHWVEFMLPIRVPNSGARRPSIWHRGWNVAGLRRALAPFAGALAFRHFTPPQEDEGLSFVRGSQQELQDLYHAAHLYFALTASQGNKPTAPWLPKRAATSVLRSRLAIQAETQQQRLSYSDYRSIIPSQLMELLLVYNLPVGGEWQRQKWYFSSEEKKVLARKQQVEYNARVDYQFIPHRVELTAEVPAEPSAHERMEASLTLREWLRDRVGLNDQRIAELLR